MVASGRDGVARQWDLDHDLSPSSNPRLPATV